MSDGRDGPRFGYCDGAFVPIAECRVSVLDRGLLFAEAIYEVLPIVAGRCLLTAEHAARMKRSAAAVGLSGAPDARKLGEIGETLAAREAVGEGMLYMQLTGGAGQNRMLLPDVRPPSLLFGFVQPLVMPDAQTARRPVCAVTRPDLRWARCDLKTSMLLPAALARAEAPEADEVIFFDGDQMLTEGGSTSVFVVRDGVLIWPPLLANLLPSVTRDVIAGLAAEGGIEVRAQPVPRHWLTDSDELGLASTTKLVRAVGTLDGASIAVARDGVCVRLAAMLRAQYGLG